MNPFPMQMVEPNEKTSLSHGQNRHELQNVLEIRSVNTCYHAIFIFLTLQNLKKDDTLKYPMAGSDHLNNNCKHKLLNRSSLFSL